jgi:hypothetical protein
LVTPPAVQIKAVNIYGLPTARAYEKAVDMALSDGADYILTVEDDTFPPPDGFVRLYNLISKHEERGEKVIIGGWYPKRSDTFIGTPIILENGRRTDLKPDGAIHEVYTIPQGFTLFPVQVFKELTPPYFAVTDNLSQDSWFSQLAREAGWKLLVDTALRCKHIDRKTGKVYE